jgi:membrane-associated phospholipid phosphatase
MWLIFLDGFWQFITRLGEAQILLPVALALSWWVARRSEARPVVQRWLALVAIAALLTTVTKVAFLGWGVGSGALNFTGLSGHAMFAAAVYPPLLYFTAASRSTHWRRAAWLAGYAIALLVAVSRVMVEAHSWSEVVSGFCVGAAASGSALVMARMRHPSVSLWWPAGIAFWLAIMPMHAPASVTHDRVTRLALTLSGRQEPHTRFEMLRAYHRRHGESSSPQLR